MGSAVRSVSFGYKKDKFRIYDEYVRIGDLIDAQRAIEINYKGCILSAGHDPEMSLYLVKGCIVGITPKTTRTINSTHYNLRIPEEIGFLTTQGNILALRSLLRETGLPSKVKLHNKDIF